MEIDLLKTKEELLIDQCKIWGYFSKAMIMDYGLKNYYLRADRTVRTLVNERKIRRIPQEECVFRGFKGRMAWYEWIGENQ